MREDSSLQEKVVRANVDFYKQIAAKYDRYETCATDAHLQEMLGRDLDGIAAGLSWCTGPIQCLDCGGGTGNLTLKMLERGWSVTVVDVSSDMLDILEAKVKAAGYVAELVNDSIEGFLAQTKRSFELVTFSSVLHHLYSPIPVVTMAAERVPLRGFFYSNFDHEKSARPLLSLAFLTLDTILAKALYDRSDFLPGVARRARKFFLRGDAEYGRPVAGPGDLAEYHDREGLDSKEIAKALESRGFYVQMETYAGGRTKIARRINENLGALMWFKILAQRVPA